MNLLRRVQDMSVEVTGLTIHSDGSGAPAVVVVGRYRFACDTLGKRTAVHGLNATGSCREQRSAAMKARHAYNSAVLFNTTHQWRERNRAMYADLN